MTDKKGGSRALARNKNQNPSTLLATRRVFVGSALQMQKTQAKEGSGLAEKPENFTCQL